MAPKKTKRDDGDNIPQNSKPVLDLKEKIRKHISDINDTISDEDIRDAQLPAEEMKEEKSALLAENEQAEEANEQKTPWTTIEGGD